MSHQHIAAALCLTLAGCGIIPTSFGGGAQQTAASHTASRDGSCEAIATERAKDAGYNGYDAELQKHVYDYTYADCVKFQQRHRR